MLNYKIYNIVILKSKKDEGKLYFLFLTNSIKDYYLYSELPIV